MARPMTAAELEGSGAGTARETRAPQPASPDVGGLRAANWADLKGTSQQADCAAVLADWKQRSAELAAQSAELAAETERRLRAILDITGPAMEPSRREDRRYVAGAHPPDWQHVSVLAARLRVHENTAFRIAGEASAQWPHGAARKVDMSKFRDTLPNLQKIAGIAT